jgi:hypothetical protein
MNGSRFLRDLQFILVVRILSTTIVILVLSIQVIYVNDLLIFLTVHHEFV